MSVIPSLKGLDLNGAFAADLAALSRMPFDRLVRPVYKRGEILALKDEPVVFEMARPRGRCLVTTADGGVADVAENELGRI